MPDLEQEIIEHTKKPAAEPEPEVKDPEVGEEDGGERGEAERPTIDKDKETGDVKVTLPEGPTRKERRAQRYQRISELEGQVGELRGRLESLQRAPVEPVAAPAPPPAAPEPAAQRLREKLKPIWKQQENVQRLLGSGKITDATDLQNLQDQWYDLETQRALIIAEFGQASAAPSAPPVSAEEAIVKAEFPDVVKHPQAMIFAMGTYHRLKAELWAEGKQPTLDTQRQALREAGERFGIIKKLEVAPPRPTAVQQARLGAVPGQAGGRGAEREVRLTKEQQEMALARFGDEDEAGSYAKFAELLRRTGT